jgi:hypothetical protein
MVDKLTGAALEEQIKMWQTEVLPFIQTVQVN